MPFGLYLHFPFCPDSHISCDSHNEPYDASLEGRFYEALTKETELVAGAHQGDDREVATVYIGGGQFR